MTKTIEQLQAKVAELEAEVDRLKTTPPDQRQDLHCVVSDISAECRELRQQLKAAQEECEFQRNAHKQAEELMLEQSKQLAAEQLNNKLLRDALEFLNARIVTMDLGGVVERALSLPTSTEALDKYVEELGG